LEALTWEREAIERLKTRLVESRRRLLRAPRDIPSDESRVDADDLPDLVDTAASDRMQSVRIRVHEHERSLLRKIETALRRLAEDRFATCDRCGQEIPRDRLEALPVTTLCLDCQEEEERELRRAFWRRSAR
jgi:RNA polymerase-binding transcription factor